MSDYHRWSCSRISGIELAEIRTLMFIKDVPAEQLQRILDSKGVETLEQLDWVTLGIFFTISVRCNHPPAISQPHFIYLRLSFPRDSVPLSYVLFVVPMPPNAGFATAIHTRGHQVIQVVTRTIPCLDVWLAVFDFIGVQWMATQDIRTHRAFCRSNRLLRQ